MHVPGWHDRTRELRADGRIQMLGIIQEQHPQRARLFMQWKEMGWPLLVDSLDLLDVGVVPMTVLIDERGVVRALQPDAATFDEFLDSAPTAAAESRPDALAPLQPEKPDLARLEKTASDGNAAALQQLADALFLWGGESGLERAIDSYERALTIDADEGRTAFRLGVAHRRRYDSARRHDDDFATAVSMWGTALDTDPNQYIWRRRIQQYGPRLGKPYPFYDWVNQAREDITRRNETPVKLANEPGGAEIARPARAFVVAATTDDPDPQGRIDRDEKSLIHVERTVVPARVAPGQPARVHLVLRPDADLQAHWNNEAGDLVVWLAPPDGWAVDSRQLSLTNPPDAVSDEPRRLEFEVQSPERFSGEMSLPAYALYYVCEGVNGTCLYRRQDIPIRLVAGTD